MNNNVSVKPPAWFRYWKRSPETQLRLICFPPAGSGANFYRQWARHIPAGVELLAVKYPGREDRSHEAFASDIVSLSGQIADAIASLVGHPTALFGHSMGAAVAHEVTKRLAQRGRSVKHLFVSGRPPPHRQRNRGIHRRDDEGVFEEIARLGGTPEEVLQNKELREFLLPVIRSDFRIIETYVGGQSPQVLSPVTAFIGDSDSEVSEDEARCWADVTKGAFRLKLYQGGHFYLQDQQADLIAQIVSSLSLPVSKTLWPSTP